MRQEIVHVEEGIQRIEAEIQEVKITLRILVQKLERLA